MQKHHVGIAILVAVLLAGGAYLLLTRTASAPADENETAPGTPEGAVTSQKMRVGDYAVVMQAQQPGNSLIVPAAVFGKAGFVVVEEDGLAPTEGRIRGTSTLLRPGEHQKIEIPLSVPSKAGETLYVYLYVDDGDGTFDPVQDAPATNSYGTIMAEAMFDEKAGPIQEIAM